jgi:hypothetical protein
VSTEEIRLDDAVIRFLAEDLCEFHFTQTAHAIDIATVKKMHQLLFDRLGEEERIYMLVSTESGARMTQEAREYASSDAFNTISKADAIIRADYSHEMAANFFIRFNRPGRPVKLFPDREKALAWIDSLREA